MRRGDSLNQSDDWYFSWGFMEWSKVISVKFWDMLCRMNKGLLLVWNRIIFAIALWYFREFGKLNGILICWSGEYK